MVDLSTEDSRIVDVLLDTIGGKPLVLDCFQIIPAMTTWAKMKASNLSAKALVKMTPIITGYFKGIYPNLSVFLSTRDIDDFVSLEAEVKTIDAGLAKVITVLGGELCTISSFVEHFSKRYPDIYAALI